jgi:hypothetical protein
LKLPELPVDVPLPAVVLKVEKIFAVLVLPHCGQAICAAPWERSVNRSNVVPHASQRYSKMGIDYSLLIRLRGAGAHEHSSTRLPGSLSLHIIGPLDRFRSKAQKVIPEVLFVQVHFPLLRVFRRRRCLANNRQPLIVREHTRVSLTDEDRQLRSE